MWTKGKSVVVRALWLTTLLIGVVLMLGAVSPVYADTIGIAVGSVGPAAAVGTATSDGAIRFHIPLTSSASRTWGIFGKGTSSRTYSKLARSLRRF